MKFTAKISMSKVLAMFLSIALVISVCTGNVSAESEGNFQYEPYTDVTGEYGVCVTGYTGGQSQVTVPDSIQGMPVLKISGTFANQTNITKIELPDTIVEIGENTFAGCSSLKTIITSEQKSQDYTAEGGVATEQTTEKDSTTKDKSTTAQSTEKENAGTESDKTTTQKQSSQSSTTQSTTTQSTTTQSTTTQAPLDEDGEYKKEKEGRVVLPPKLRSIGNGAFNNCSSIKEVFIDEKLSSVGVRSFYQCTSLEHFQVSKKNPVYLSDSFGVLYQKYVGEDLSAYTGVPSSPSAVTYHLVRWPIALPINTYDLSGSQGCYPMHDNLSVIDAYACENVNFGGKGLVIGGPCYVIGDYAFYHCKDLSQEMRFAPECATVTIGNYAFSGNPTIHEVTLPATVKTLGAYCFADCDNLDTVHFNNGLQSIKEGCFLNCRTLHDMIIPEGITTIENGTFEECTNLGTVILPQTLTTIGDNAFKDCVTIHTMVIPPNVKYISNSSFSGIDLSKIDFSQNTNLAQQFGVQTVDPVLQTPSFVLKKKGKAHIYMTLNGDEIASYTLNKAAKKKIKVSSTGAVTVKKNAKPGLVKVTVTMKSAKVYTVKIYITKEKIVKVKKKAITLKKGKKMNLVYGSDPLSVHYTVPKSAKKYLSVNKYGIVTAKKYKAKKFTITVKPADGKAVKQKIKIKK